MTGNPRHKRRRIWINPRFQTRYTALIVGVAVGLLAVLGTLYLRTLSEERRLVGLSRVCGGAGNAPVLDDSASEFDREFAAEVGKDDTIATVSLVGGAAAIVLVLALVGVRITFRAAGPVFAVSGMLRQMAQNNFGAVRPLREGDEFRFLGDDVKVLRDAIRREAGADVDMMQRAVETLQLAALGKADRTLLEGIAAELAEVARIRQDRFGLVPGRPRGTGPVAPEDAPVVHASAFVDEGANVGNGSRIWHFCHVMKGAVIGRDCMLGQNVFVADGARLGSGVRIQNGVSVFKGVVLEDGVFVGPNATFTNVKEPRSFVDRKSGFLPTLVRIGATLGANCTIVCGRSVGQYAFVGAGAVVTRDVPDHAMVAGNPARPIGWACRCGLRLEAPIRAPEGQALEVACAGCRTRYRLSGDTLEPAAGSGRG